VSLAAGIASQREQYQVPHAVSCRALGVSQAWFYKWRGGYVPARAARRAALAAEVARLFAAHRGTYGSPRITADLRDAGWAVSENTVAAVMRERHLAARRKKGRRATTRPGRGRWRAPDLVKLYLASVLDIGSRRILGFALSEHHDADLAYGALAMAAAVRGGQVAGVIMHTDQGSEYTAGTFRQACTRLRIRQSMGRPGSALDNAAIESFHSTLEFELRSLEDFPTRAAARTRVAAWIDEYNTIRRHSAIGMISPAAYEASQNRGQAA